MKRLPDHVRAYHRLKPGLPGIIEPEAPHFVTPQGAVEFFVEFYKAP